MLDDLQRIGGPSGGYIQRAAVGAIAYTDSGLSVDGFPNDTPERLTRDIKTVQDELSVDLLEFFILTPLPGWADHQLLNKNGVWMDPDMNKYDLEHVTTGHSTMSPAEWQATYRQAFELYYSPEHIERLFRRAKASGIKPVRLVNHVLQFYFTFMQEKVHPLQGGFFRRKVRTQRRPGLPLENPLVFYPRRLAEIVTTHVNMARYYLFLHRLGRRSSARLRPIATARWCWWTRNYAADRASAQAGGGGGFAISRTRAGRSRPRRGRRRAARPVLAADQAAEAGAGENRRASAR